MHRIYRIYFTLRFCLLNLALSATAQLLQACTVMPIIGIWLWALSIFQILPLQCFQNVHVLEVEWIWLPWCNEKTTQEHHTHNVIVQHRFAKIERQSSLIQHTEENAIHHTRSAIFPIFILYLSISDRFPSKVQTQLKFDKLCRFK